MSVDFQKYLQSVCDVYQRWWELYTITDVEGSKTAQRQNSPSPFDFGLVVETVQAKQQERSDAPEKKDTQAVPALIQALNHEDSSVRKVLFAPIGIPIEMARGWIEAE
ncbi:hypothetical protein BZZ01_28445 [Nostocales cyanobacterium HT-58-2]|nr:hypothetical protein BZZ01_28445 [Nostocales cyanobacterium HT-58-2]